MHELFAEACESGFDAAAVEGARFAERPALRTQCVEPLAVDGPLWLEVCLVDEQTERHFADEFAHIGVQRECVIERGAARTVGNEQVTCSIAQVVAVDGAKALLPAMSQSTSLSSSPEGRRISRVSIFTPTVVRYSSPKDW